MLLSKQSARARAADLARLALRQDPTAVQAVATLGLDAQLRGHTAAARRLLVYGNALSRRDLQLRLWAIEDAVGRNDIPAALVNYDVALRTSRTAPELLFPVLAAATDDQAIRLALVKTLSGKPAWAESFIFHAAVNAPNPRAVASLYRDLRRAGVSVLDEASSVVINRLISGGFWEDAWSYYAAIHPGADRRTSRDPLFTSRSTTPSLFDWTPINDAGVTTSIQPGNQKGVFDFAASPSVGGTLLQQIQVLPAGDYRLVGRSAGIDQDEGARPYWILTCRRDGRELGRIVLPNSSRLNGLFSGQFSVPSGCPVQVLALVARPSNSASGMTGQIEQARLYPVR
ncbi:hypothetical protein HJG53_16990 [Sphingomonas sp. ID1715]|uniref:hypothetical protein n=1 Tax=Sphingomonas sp. ID1715 TaxID=1656898 RepID=UPI00179696F1|nr:hypothetical protein [Sphingomonas sp. ID1715]NNM78586.1 hypothetical protein [Sphingomonas sp. ID1715]